MRGRRMLAKQPNQHHSAREQVVRRSFTSMVAATRVIVGSEDYLEEVETTQILLHLSNHRWLLHNPSTALCQPEWEEADRKVVGG